MARVQQGKEAKIGHGSSVSMTEINHPSVKVSYMNHVELVLSRSTILRCYDEASAP